ncbi:MAG: sugar phosphate isomerase/epimerase [Gemmatimonadota bacterium]|nr:sugar phosphate isomerase/epimerase [Gemmatimonadota bacterium]
MDEKSLTDNRQRVDRVLGTCLLAYSTTNFLKFPLTEALERIAAGGFRNVEIWGNLKHLDPRSETEDVKEVAETCRRLELRVVSIHAPFTLQGVSSPPDERMRTWEALVSESMEQAGFLGARLLVVHPVTAGADESLADYREIVKRTGDSLVKLADMAGKKEMRLAVENMPGHRSRRFGREVGDLYSAVTEGGRENLGLCLDTGHVIFNNGDPVRDLELYHDRIFSIHMNDNIWGMHMDLHLVPGAGSVDWERFRTLLVSLPFEGMIVLELDGRGRPSSVFDEAGRFVKRFFEQDEQVGRD